MNLTEELQRLTRQAHCRDLALGISGCLDDKTYRFIPKGFFGPNQVNKAQHRRVKEKHFRDAFMSVSFGDNELCDQYIAALENIEKKRI